MPAVASAKAHWTGQGFDDRQSTAMALAGMLVAAFATAPELELELDDGQVAHVIGALDSMRAQLAAGGEQRITGKDRECLEFLANQMDMLRAFE